MRAIFISYRRSDSEGEAGRLSDLLTSRFSDQSVFMDVDSIQPGRDFRKAIEESIQACSVALVLIGPGWLDAVDARGGRRLDAPNDYVRLEIAAALRRDVPVIPVLVRGAHMPQADQLPQEIHDLAYRNSVELTHARWKSDLQVLIDALEPLLQKTASAPAPVSAHRPSFTPAPAPALPPRHTLTPRPAQYGSHSHYSVPSSSHRGIVIPPRTPAPAHEPAPVRSAPMQHHPAHAEPGIIRPATAPAVPVHLEHAAIERVARHLAHFIGPIAEIVVKRAAKKAASEAELCATVSHEIESAAERAKFLAQCKGK